MHIGQHGTYRVPEEHHTATETKAGVRLGSVHHASMREFFAIVGADHGDGTGDVALVVPGKGELVWAHGVQEGEGPGQFAPEHAD